MNSSSCIDISRKALQKNLGFIRKRIGPGVRLSSVVKGNAYGHGIEHFVPLAEECGVRHFSVFSADEAYRAFGCLSGESDILILGDIRDEQIEWAIENDIAFYVFDRGRLRAAAEAAERVGKKARLHVEVETGFHRTGFEPDEFEETTAFLLDHGERLRMEGLCTHLAGAESTANDFRIQKQQASYGEACDYFRARLGAGFLRHVACSAATLLYREAHFDLVRVGIAQYGYWPSEETRMRYLMEHRPEGNKRFRSPLKRVLRWHSRIMSVKEVREGDFVGYGNSYMAARSMKVAAVPVGYFHGFSRSLSNLGHVLVQGKRSPVVGLVNMNMMLVDVTECPRAERGDEVVIIGSQGRSEISVQSFISLTRSVNYETLVRIPAGVDRVVVE